LRPVQHWVPDLRDPKVLAEIRRHSFHMTNVARALGLERSHLYKKCQQLGIDLQSLRKPE